MKKFIAMALCAICVSVTAWGAVGGGGSGQVAADGLIQFVPPQVLGCVAVRVEVPENKMITGVMWYNGTATQVFPRVLVASGSDLAPPPYSAAVVVGENIQGQDHGWSSVAFATPVASESGTLFIVLEYPANYAPTTEAQALGVGYCLEAARYPYFVTGDGETWNRITRRCRVLLEPVLADRLPGVMSLRGLEQAPISAVAVARLGLFATPNPFNPQTKIELALAAASSGTLRVYDLRGRLVVELHHGAFAQGVNAFVWNGRDVRGRQVASGPYWVQARTADRSLTKKVMLLK